MEEAQMVAEVGAMRITLAALVLTGLALWYYRRRERELVERVREAGL